MATTVTGTSIIRDAFATYIRHAPLVLGVSALISGIGLVGSIAAMNAFGAAGIVAFGVLTVASSVLTAAALAILVARRAAGAALGSITELCLAAARRTLPLAIGMVLLYGVIAVGIALALIPGVFLAVRLSVALPLIATGLGVRAAINASWTLTRGPWNAAFVVILLAAAIQAVLPQLISRAAGGELAAFESYVFAIFIVGALVEPIAGLALGELSVRVQAAAAAAAWDGAAPAQPAPVVAASPWTPAPATPSAAASPWTPAPATPLAWMPAPAAVAAAPPAAWTPPPTPAAPRAAWIPTPLTSPAAPTAAAVPPAPQAGFAPPSPAFTPPPAAFAPPPPVVHARTQSIPPPGLN